MQRAGRAAANHALAGAVLTLHTVSYVNGAPLKLCNGPMEGRAVGVEGASSHSELSFLIQWGLE